MSAIQIRIWDKSRSFGFGRPYFGFGVCLLFLGLSLAVSASNAPAQDLEKYRNDLQNGSVEEKREALFQIRNLRSAEASRIAVPALRDSDEMVRATAAGSVIFLPPTEAVIELVPLLNDRSEFVRREAAYALGKVGDPSAVPRLVQSLRTEKSLEVRAAVAVGLGGIGDFSAISSLLETLRSAPNEEEEFLRRSAARGIGQTAQLIQTGRSNAVTPQNFLPDQYKRFREKKHARLTSEFPEFVPAVPILISILNNSIESDDTRREAAYSLGAIGDPAAIPVLEKYRTSDDRYLSEICREAILKINETD